MAHDFLETYLLDHHAGSVAAIELMDHLSSSYKQTDIPGFIHGLKTEIEADRLVLEDLMSQLGVEESKARKASAWVGSKLTEMKFMIDDPNAGPLHLFQALEILSLGIEGKRSLWVALGTAAEVDPKLDLINYDRMADRAADQRTRVEARRLEAARQALATHNASESKSSGL
jgi:hypothetical protein